MAKTRQARINIRSVANAKAAKKVKRNGRDLVIVPSATLPDGVVMNGIRYPAAEIEKGYKTLERSPAPFGHPTVNGLFVSARDPEGLNIGYVGAWNENVRRKDGRVFLDKVIDVEVANRSENGKRLLKAIETGDEIHTSTGLFANLVETGEDDVEWEACDMVFDHDAILLDEEGAATPSQGVGMFVNKDGQEVEVINSSLSDMVDDQLDWALDSVARALEQRQRLPMIERLKSALTDVFGGRETSRAQENADMAVDEKKVADLENRLEQQGKDLAKLSTDFAGLGDTIANAVKEALAPVVTSVEALTNADKARADAEKTALVNRVVEAALLTKETAEGLTVAALNELSKTIKPGKAAALNSSKPADDAEDEFKGYSLNANVDAVLGIDKKKDAA